MIERLSVEVRSVGDEAAQTAALLGVGENDLAAGATGAAGTSSSASPAGRYSQH